MDKSLQFHYIRSNANLSNTAMPSTYSSSHLGLCFNCYQHTPVERYSAWRSIPPTIQVPPRYIFDLLLLLLGQPVWLTLAFAVEVLTMNQRTVPKTQGSYMYLSNLLELQVDLFPYQRQQPSFDSMELWQGLTVENTTDQHPASGLISEKNALDCGQLAMSETALEAF
ncbi:hypothetical protein C8R43DRAFT_520986 [Mycena crocata]|nr:hypothetical protein C8R43DRAFT_520986 [Mycena crocata]